MERRKLKDSEKLRKQSFENFCKEVEEMYGPGAYELKLENYTGRRYRMQVKCLKCGNVFMVRPETLVSKNPKYRRYCPCLRGVKDAKIMNNTLFIYKANLKYGPGAYGYDKVNYTGYNKKVQIWCPTCKEYVWIIPNIFLNKPDIIGCPKCAQRHAAEKHRLTTEEWVEIAKRTRPDSENFDYTNTVYTRDDVKLQIYCNVHHGYFDTLPRTHLVSKFGCPICARHAKESIGERYTNQALDELGIPHMREQIITGIEGRNENYVKIDFILDNNIWIEYNGEQHYCEISHFHETTEDFLKQVKRDNNVKAYCEANGIDLIVIPYTIEEYQDILGVLQKILIDKIQKDQVITLPEVDYVRKR
jgi:hypothetical protein